MSSRDSDDVRSLLITAREERDEARKQLDEWMEWAAVETDASEGDGAEQMRSVISETINAEFERAQLAESQLTALRQERDELQRRYDALYDLPLCRLQLPDGTVPGYTEEALEAWHRVAMDLLQQVRVLRPGGTFAWKYQAEQLASQLAERDEAITILRELTEDCTCEFRDCAIHDAARAFLESFPPSPTRTGEAP